MIIWIASYPKSGNTWLRALLSTYYFSKDGEFNQNLLKEIDQFPTNKYMKDFDFDKNIPGDTCKHWIKAQEKANLDKRLKFFKTHNIFGKLDNYDFTNNRNSIGVIYVVRDPRNVITSVKNHYQLNDDQAYQWITNEKNYIYNTQRFEELGYSDFQYISSWSINYISWTVQKRIPIKLIKYEDLSKYTYAVFLEVIEFIKKITNSKHRIDKNKIKKTLRTTSFEALKKNEIDQGFSESIPLRSDKNKRVPFFFLGPKNDWKKMLNENYRDKIEKVFGKELEDLKYK